MRRDPKPVAGGKLFTASQVGEAERVFSDDLAAMRDSDDAAGLLRRPQLEFDPVADISDCGLHPWLHMRPKMSDSCSDRRYVEKLGKNSPGCYRTKRNRRNFKAAPANSCSPKSVNEAGAGRLFQRCGERAIFLAVGAGQGGDLVQMILRRVAVALFDLPEAVVLPGLDVVGVGLERALVPDLRDLVVAELAIGVADQIGHRGAVVVTERFQLRDGGGVVVAVIDRVVGRAITPGE